MAKRGGFGGFGGGNRNNMMQQMKKLQRQMEETQKRVDETEVEATAGGGAVRVCANGKREILSITVEPELLDPEEVEMLQDLLLVAINDVLRQAGELQEREMGKITGGLNIPGLV